MTAHSPERGQAGPGAAGRDDVGEAPSVGRAVAEAESELARPIEQLGGTAAAFVGLANAHQKSMAALLEYDRIQEELFRALQAGSTAPADQVNRLLELSAAHRKLMKTRIDYDETLWGLVRTHGTKPPAVRRAQPSGPAPPSTLTRGGVDEPKATR